MKKNSPEYIGKKKFFNQFLTVYGRKPTLEALSCDGVEVHRLHLCQTNRPDKLLEDITRLATEKGAETIYHSRDELSRISKNKKQDQGVAVDIKAEGFQEFDDFLREPPRNFELIALDRVTNPQNLGMIIRSVCASPLTGLLLPRNGCAKLDALVIKASAGTLFKAKIIRCDKLSASLQKLQHLGVKLVAMSAQSQTNLKDLSSQDNRIFVLGNETDGVSPEITPLCDYKVKIPMNNDVESLNVAVTASLIAFRGHI